MLCMQYTTETHVKDIQVDWILGFCVAQGIIRSRTNLSI